MRPRLWQWRIFILTFLAYSLYTSARLPMSVTKSALSPNPEDQKAGWAPFEGDGEVLLGTLDTCFLAAYSAGLFVSGHIGDRVNLRYFLAVGMLGAGGSVVLFGLAKPWSIHSLGYFIFCSLLSGIFQSTGWPAVVTVMARWFGQGQRGLLFGIWNSHSSVGNVVGKVLSSAALSRWDWSAAFILAGTLCAVCGIAEAFFLVAHPKEVLSPREIETLFSSQRSLTAYRPPEKPAEAEAEAEAEAKSAAKEASGGHEGGDEQHPNISFRQALAVPGVIQYSLALFCSKLITYAFLFWLPYYLHTIGYASDTAGLWSTIFDVGGLCGGVLAGWLSDKLRMRGIVSFLFLILTIPMLGIMSAVMAGGSGDAANMIMMFLVGALVSGPYSLISGAVSVDLGSHASLRGNPRAMSTVCGIIDGTGGVGAAVQGVLIGAISRWLGWGAVFYMLMFFCLLAALMISRIVHSEWKEYHRGPHALHVLRVEMPILAVPTGGLSTTSPRHNPRIIEEAAAGGLAVPDSADGAAAAASMVHLLDSAGKEQTEPSSLPAPAAADVIITLPADNPSLNHQEEAVQAISATPAEQVS